MRVREIPLTDLMRQRANEIEEAGHKQAANLLLKGAEVIANIQEELLGKQQFLDDGWGDKPCQKTVAQTVKDEIELLSRMLPKDLEAEPTRRPGELRHCRRCGRTGALKVEVHDGGYTVCCGHCVNKHRGGYASTPERAIELWNQGVDWTQQ